MTRYELGRQCCSTVGDDPNAHPLPPDSGLSRKRTSDDDRITSNPDESSTTRDGSSTPTQGHRTSPSSSPASPAPIAVVEARARQVIERVRLVATLSSLEHLVRSGRVPGVAGWAGRRLGINPLFEFRGGKVLRLRPALSQEAALERIVAMVRRARPAGSARLHVAALHALAVDTATDLFERVREFEPVTEFVGEFGPVMVVHTGPGLAGLAWWWEG